MNPFVGTVMLFAGNFAPRNWMYCKGQILNIAEHQILFSLLGATYGGDGTVTFQLPDLRGRVPIGTGSGPGLTHWSLGQQPGSEYTYLTTQNLPAHSHLATGSATATATATAVAGGKAAINATATLHADSTAATNDPTGNFIANSGTVGSAQRKIFGSTSDIKMNDGAVTVEGTVDLGNIPAPEVTVDVNNVDVIIRNTGSGTPVLNIQPSLGLNYIICTTGLYPSRTD